MPIKAFFWGVVMYKIALLILILTGCQSFGNIYPEHTKVETNRLELENKSNNLDIDDYRGLSKVLLEKHDIVLKSFSSSFPTMEIVFRKYGDFETELTEAEAEQVKKTINHFIGND